MKVDVVRAFAIEIDGVTLVVPPSAAAKLQPHSNRLAGKVIPEMSFNKTYSRLRPQPTRRTSWKLVANPGWQPGFPTSCQLVRNFLGCLSRHVVRDLSRCQLVRQVGNLLQKWNVENDQACNKLPTSFQLVRLVGCGLYRADAWAQAMPFLFTI